MKNRHDRNNPDGRLTLTIQFVVCAAFLFVAFGVVPWTGETSHGYAAYYTSARLVLADENPARFYENRWFREQTIDAGFQETTDIFNVNPPTTSLLFIPLVWLSPGDADIVWSIVNVALLATGVWVVFRSLTVAGIWSVHPRHSGLLLAGVVLVYHPVYENFRYGQMYVLVFLLLALALLAYVRGDERRLGVWLGLMFVAKSAGVLLWLIPVLDRRYRTLVWGVGTVAVSVLAAAPLLGLRVWSDYLVALPSLRNQPWTGVTAYQTTASLVHHLTRAEPPYSPDPLVDARWLTGPLTMIVAVGLTISAIVFGWLLARELPVRQTRLIRFGLLSALAIPLQPVGEEHHYVLLLPAVVAALALASQRPLPGLHGGIFLFAVVLGTLCLTFPLPFESGVLEPGWRAIFAYPKVYGALLLAAAYCVWLADDPRTWATRLRHHWDAVLRRSRSTGAALQMLSPSRVRES